MTISELVSSFLGVDLPILTILLCQNILHLYLVPTESNNMVGNIPPEIGTFFAMTSYISFFNAQTGTIPSTLGYILPLETLVTTWMGLCSSRNMQDQTAYVK
jgi:hypothetical protein